jgi:hypothetical protein
VEDKEQSRYRAYLLRIWLVGSVDAPTWRISLEDAHTREHRSFASLEQVCTFLDRQIRADSGDGSPDIPDRTTE